MGVINMIIGFIGLGAMGKPMAHNLIKANFQLNVFDVNEKAVEELVLLGAEKCSSPQEIAKKCELVITMLPNAKIVESVMLGDGGMLAGIKAGQIIVDMSSVAPHTTKKMAQFVEKKGAKYIDAPVSGGVSGATAGTLTIMVGGHQETVAKARPVLDKLGRIQHIGEVGAGDAVKIVNNLLLGANMAAVAEALVLGVKAGLKPETMYNIIKSSSGRSYALEAKMPNFILKGEFAPGFAVDLQYKDLELAVETGKNLGVPMPVTNSAQQVYEMARAKGLGREDISAIIKVWEHLLNVQVRGDVIE